MKMLKFLSLIVIPFGLAISAQASDDLDQAADKPILLEKKINEVIIPGEFVSIGDVFDLESIEAMDGVRIIQMIVHTRGGEKALVKVNGKDIAQFKSGKSKAKLNLRWGPEVANFVLKPVGKSMVLKSITLLLDHGDVEKLRKQARLERRDKDNKE